jgi:sugar O-acyltransferase (sialic acid O-acetyltransferase NeuD family)
MILWGGTGQAKVVRPIIEHYQSKVVAVFDDTPGLPPPFPDVPLYEGWKDFPQWAAKQDLHDIGFCIAIGNPHGRVRLRFHEQLVSEGLQPVTVAHPTAVIAENAVIGEGCQLMAGAIVNPEAVLGRQCIVNTKGSVDHECVLSDGCEVGPGATLCGLVTLNTGVWVCAGATVLPRVTVAADSIIGAGAVVIRDITDRATVVGVPAKAL